ncbi:WD40-repeat-containing domain protein [Cercophora samala]|uniref:WD40-repeat-containing domain protein n=1 Tax=Cercophora samala TaxID=330535 RepID=A0AA39ZCG1_9PEZI|nr:WD40-repeat-containing domain protein [Cercophora samala]
MAQTSTPHPRTQLQQTFVLSPITALEFYHAESNSSYLLAGEDTWLRIYDPATSRLVSQLGVFNSRPIHGIHAWKSEDGTPTIEGGILIWGGQSVIVLPPSSVASLIQGTTPSELPTEFQAPDWIYDGILFSSNGETQGALVTTHNEIVTLKLSSEGNLLELGPVVSPSRPILYSANLTFLGDNTILIAGGTVFGEIIVWKFYLDSSRPSQWEVLYVFSGHEGSIFGVTISPEIEVAPGSKVRLLASCSDDRTIRIWDITDRQISITQDGMEIDSKTLGEARETGFGGNSEVKEENRNDSTRCVAVAMGHLSRIWHVKFGEYTPASRGPINVYSFGEDTTRQKWELSLDLTGSEGPKGALKHCTTDSCHNGKNIWSAAVANKEGQASLIATGGADGKIVISGGMSRSGSEVGFEDFDLSLSFDDVLQHIQKNSGAPSMDPLPMGDSKQAFQKYAFMSDTSVVATTSPGRIFVADIQGAPTWREVQLPAEVVADLKSYNVMKTVALDKVVLGSAAGNVYVLQSGKPIQFVEKLPGKIQDILPLVGADLENWQAVVTVLGADNAYILNFNTSTNEASFGDVTLSLKEHYIPTAAAQVGSAILLGSRVGVVTIYSLSRDSQDPAGSLLPRNWSRDPKTKDAITAVVPLPGSSRNFLTTCRDGKYRMYSIWHENRGFDLRHEISPPMGMIEGAWFTTTESPELILHGFKGKQFIYYNATTSAVLASLECGGAHRSFAITSPLTDPNALRLIFTKSSHLRFYSQSSTFLRTIKEGGHGREIRAVACSSSFKYIATAAEDTVIRIWSKSPTGQGFKCLATLEKHSSGIQSLQWKGDNTLVSCGGSEELFIWSITRLESDYETIAVKCEAVWNFHSKDKDLRIMAFEFSNNYLGEYHDEFVIALSNSTIQTYAYGERTHEFEFGSEARYTGACPTQLRYMPNGDILVAYTDGHIAIWTRPFLEPDPEVTYANKAPLEMVLLLKVHQSSIKSLDVVDPEDCHYVIATGGDDNALIITDLRVDDDGKYTVCGRYRVSSAHGAAVTGLKIVRDDTDMIEVVTVSNDQRIKLWRAVPGEDGQGMKISLQDNRYSGIADVGDVEVIESGKVLVGGVGMEVWDFNPFKWL